METKFNIVAALLLMFVVQFSFAQEKLISGNVSDSTGPLFGVNIIIKGTTKGTETDFDGNYSLKANKGDILEFSYVGMEKVTKIIGDSNTINVVMKSENVLEEVVITAQGIKKEKKALGYAVSKLDAKIIQQKPQTDLTRMLTGKIAGVKVSQEGGMLGSGTSIVVRSKTSITGSNSPLFIVDGVPVTAATFSQLNPENIVESSVLKGLSASVKYGEEGRNGVIIVTTKGSKTKDATKKFEISASSITSLYQVANLPEFQNKYGQGGFNKTILDAVGSWGGKLDGHLVPHPLSNNKYFPEYKNVKVPFKAIPDNVSRFFKTGIGQNTTIGINSGNEKASISLNLARLSQTGYLQGNSLERLNFDLGGNMKLSNNFTISSKVRYSDSSIKTPDMSIFNLLLVLPRNFDIHNMPYENPYDKSNVYYRNGYENPLWVLNNVGYNNKRKNINLSASFTYDVTEKINLLYRYGFDYTNLFNDGWHNKGGIAGNSKKGWYTTDTGFGTISNHAFITSFKNLSLTDDIKLNAQVALDVKGSKYESAGLGSTEQIVYGFFKHKNFKKTVPRSDYSYQKNVIGVWGDFSFDYKNYLFLTLQGRNDWGSTVEKENRSTFYPSVALSFIPTTAFRDIRSEYLNYLKFRINVASSANYPRPYLTRGIIDLNATGFVDINSNTIATNSISDFRPNKNLKPEKLKELEFGLETKLFKNRVSLDISAYKRISNNQVLNSILAVSTGYSTTNINAGRIDTQGLEVGAKINPVRTSNFRWDIDANFTTYETIVKSIPSEEINLYGGINYAIPGQPLGIMKGNYMLRDDEGNLLINANDGKIILSSELGLPKKILGDPNEKWYGSITNMLSYKGIGLSFQIDYKHGGDLWNSVVNDLYLRGVTRDTEERESSYITKGVLADPDTGKVILDTNGNKIQNNIQLGANDLNFMNLFNRGTGKFVDENSIFDATTLRLREVALTYTMNAKMLKGTPFGAVSFSLTVRNLWWYTPHLPKYMNIDPEVLRAGSSGSGAGVASQNAPSTRLFAFGVKLTF